MSPHTYTAAQLAAALYTASEIATALGRKKRTILLALASVPASGDRTVRGQTAKAWTLAALPAVMQAELARAATLQNFRNAEALLQHCRHAANPPQPAPASPPSARDLHADLADALKIVPGLASLATLTLLEREIVWDKICEHFEALAAVTPKNEHGILKRSLFDFLTTAAPALAKSPAALRRNWERKMMAGPIGRADKRPANSGFHRSILCPDCWQKAVALDTVLNGNESDTWRRLKLQGKLCPACAARHPFNVRQAKSRVPNSFRRAITPLVNKALDFVKSDAAGRMAGPYIVRDWSDTAPADYFCGDDVSWNHKVWTTDAKGQPFLCRPECLYLGDHLTSYPVHFILIAGDLGQAAHYNATHVRTLMLQAHDLTGLPHRGYFYENGVWRARTVRDESLRDEWLPWFETELGLKSLKDFVEIRHTLARNPRSKPVEGDFRILQERMRTEPGFVGFNQRAEQSDRAKRLERDFAKRVKQGSEHPGNEFLSLAQWRDRVSAILGEFANEPQNGKRLHGRSPAEAWREGLQSRPLRKLPDESRWILATHRQLATVGNKGIILKGRCYADEQLVRHIGRQVWAFYNVECPELLTVCDLKRTEYFTVKDTTVPATTARDTEEGRATLGQAQRQIAGFNRMAKVIAGTVPHTRRAFRTNDADASQAERDLGQHIAQAQAEHHETSRRRTDARTREKSAAVNRFHNRRAARAGQTESAQP